MKQTLMKSFLLLLMLVSTSSTAMAILNRRSGDMAGMFGDRSRVVVTTGQSVQEQQQQDQPVVAQERQDFADILQALAKQDAEGLANLRQSLGITQSLAEPGREPVSNLAEGTSLRPRARPTAAPDESLRPQARPEPIAPVAVPAAAPSAVQFGILDQQPQQQEQPQQQTQQTPKISGTLDEAIRDQIALHEGQVNYPYKDKLGFWTIGIGHLIGDGSDEALSQSVYAKYNKDNPMPEEEVNQLFAKDLDKHKKIAESYPFYADMSEEGKKAILDLTFNMGDFYNKKKPDGTYEWKNLRSQLDRGDWEAAADNIASSAYARQVGNRAVTVTNQLRQAGGEK
jgi:lysozyme